MTKDAKSQVVPPFSPPLRDGAGVGFPSTPLRDGAGVGWRGFLIGGCLILAGLILQVSVGPVVWESLAWPVNGIVLVAFLTAIALLSLFSKTVYALQFLSTRQAAIPAMIYAVVLTVIMGLTRQEPRGSWLNNMLSFWPFVLIYVYITVILGLVIQRSLRKILPSFSTPLRDGPGECRRCWSSLPSLLSHLGLFIALIAATLGNADMQRVKMICSVGIPESRALTQEGAVKVMPMAIELKKFIMETYDDGSPKRFASQLRILPTSALSSPSTSPKSSSLGEDLVEATIDVNKPYEVAGWKIYQYGFDTQMGAQSQISILELVSDPWLPIVYAGIYMMLAGALLTTLNVLGRRLRRATTKSLLVYLALFLFASIFAYFFFDSYNTKTLVPALQSPWFAPHVFVYIFAYSLLAVAVVIAWWTLADDLVTLSLAFLTVGMLFGALWAKEAWGHYWSWDPKETWAAITWLAYLVYIHYRQLPRQSKSIAISMLIGSFLLLQMCWWGINYLPSAQGSSVHTYNTTK